jgi:hypothetical protein
VSLHGGELIGLLCVVILRRSAVDFLSRFLASDYVVR